MTIRNVSALATAIAFASHTHAAFDPNKAVLFAYDAADDDTYFVDLGVTADQLLAGASVDITDSGLASFLANNAGAQWTILAANNGTTQVGGPPVTGASYIDNGIISSSISGNAVATTGTENVDQVNEWISWLADIQTAAVGSSSFGVVGSDPVSANAMRNAAFFDDSLIPFHQGVYVEGGTAVGSYLWYAQTDPSDGVLLTEPQITSQLFVGCAIAMSSGTVGLGYLGMDCLPASSPIPLPATAWLFLSAIGGLFATKKKLS